MNISHTLCLSIKPQMDYIQFNFQLLTSMAEEITSSVSRSETMVVHHLTQHVTSHKPVQVLVFSHKLKIDPVCILSGI